MMRCDSPRRRARRIAFGLSVIGIGILALIDNLHVVDTPLLHTFWPLIFVVMGLARLAWPRHHGGRFFGLLLILAGTLMTAHNLGHESLGLHHWWPVFLILGGVSILLRGLGPSRYPGRAGFDVSSLEHDQEVNVDATFGGIKLQNDSQTFKGGRISITFGGLELDLRDAKMEGAEAVILVHATFSAIELRIPRDWEVVPQVSVTLGAVEDKTISPNSPMHRLVLRGETVFSGVEIKN